MNLKTEEVAFLLRVMNAIPEQKQKIDEKHRQDCIKKFERRLAGPPEKVEPVSGARWVDKHIEEDFVTVVSVKYSYVRYTTCDGATLAAKKQAFWMRYKPEGS